MSDQPDLLTPIRWPVALAPYTGKRRAVRIVPRPGLPHPAATEAQEKAAERRADNLAWSEVKKFRQDVGLDPKPNEATRVVSPPIVVRDVRRSVYLPPVGMTALSVFGNVIR